MTTSSRDSRVNPPTTPLPEKGDSGSAITAPSSDDFERRPETGWSKMVFRRLVIWLAIATVSSAPSLFLATISGHNTTSAYLAMAIGIFCFALLLAVISASKVFRMRLERPFVRRSVQIGFGLRVLASLVIFPIGFILDMMPGIATVQIGEFASMVSGLPPQGFVITLFETLLQGCFLNVEILLVVGAAWLFQTTCMTWRPRSPQSCSKCGYDLGHSSQSSSHVCPECGSNAGPIGAQAEWVDRVGLGRFLLTVAAAFIATVVVQVGITAIAGTLFG